MPLPGPRYGNHVHGDAGRERIAIGDPLTVADINVKHWADQSRKASRTAHRIVMGLRQFAGSAMSAPLEEALEQVTESWSSLDEARGEQVAALLDRGHDQQQEATALRGQVRDYDSALSAERDAHLLTLRTLADRYRRAGKPIPDVIIDAIAERDLPF